MLLSICLVGIPAIPSLLSLVDDIYQFWNGNLTTINVWDDKFGQRPRPTFKTILKEYFLRSVYGINLEQRSTEFAWKKYLVGAKPDNIATMIEEDQIKNSKESLYFKSAKTKTEKLKPAELKEFDYFYEKHSPVVATCLAPQLQSHLGHNNIALQ